MKFEYTTMRTLFLLEHEYRILFDESYKFGPEEGQHCDLFPKEGRAVSHRLTLIEEYRQALKDLLAEANECFKYHPFPSAKEYFQHIDNLYDCSYGKRVLEITIMGKPIIDF